MGAGLMLSDITDHLQQEYPQVVEQAVTRNSALMSLFTRPPKKTGGYGPTWRVNYSGNTSAGSYGDGDADPVAGHQSYKQAQLAWKYNKVVLRVSRIAIDAAGGDFAQIGDIVQSEVDRGTEDLVSSMETQVMSDGTGNGAKDITGIAAAIASANTYAGIDKGVYTWFASYMQTGIGALGETHLKNAVRTLAGKPRPKSPTIAFANPTVYQIALSLFDTKFTYQSLAWDEIKRNSQYQGYECFPYGPLMVVQIPSYTSQRLDVLCLSDWELQFIRDFLVDDPTLDGDDYVWKVTVGCQLKCVAPWRQAGLTGITS